MIPSNRHPPARADFRPLVLLLILVAFVASIAWTAQLPVEADTRQSTAAATAAPIIATPTPTRFPEELTNQDQTNGIVLGSTILVLIIVIGTLTVIRQGDQRPK